MEEAYLDHADERHEHIRRAVHAHIKPHQVGDADKQLRQCLLLYCQPEVAASDYLDIIVGKADKPEGESHHKPAPEPCIHFGGNEAARGDDIAARELIGDDGDGYRGDRADNEHQPAHSGRPLLAFMPFRADIEYRLPEFQLPEPWNHGKSQPGGDGETRCARQAYGGKIIHSRRSLLLFFNRRIYRINNILKLHAAARLKENGVALVKLA